MELYDEEELQASIEAGERRLAAARQRKRRIARLRVGAFAAALVVIPFCIAAGIAAGRAPEAPLLVVTWPKPKVQQRVASGETLLFRPGQPFQLTVENADRWDIIWNSGGIENEGPEFSWSPTGQSESVTAKCRPVVGDWTSLFAFLWPTREVKLNALLASRTNDYGRRIETGGQGVWVHPQVFAVGKIAWDERALPRLVEASSAVAPESDLPSSTTPRKPIWRLVSDFEGDSDAPSSNGTFASLQNENIETKLPQIAAKLVKILPDASIKFILRLDKDPKEGILRLDFDGKRERKAWKKERGQSAGAPLTGWESGELGADSLTDLPPSLPQN